MNKVALFLAGLLLGLFFGRFYPLAHARILPPESRHTRFVVPDNDEPVDDPCENGITKLQPLYP